MTALRTRSMALRFAVTGAVAVALFAGGTVAGKTPRNASSEAAQKALGKGQVDKAIELAEAAVAANPRDAASRLVLAQSYLKAGRFNSAATTFNDAMDLGDNSARTALALALSNVAAGRNGEAVAILDDWRDNVPAGDLGLAYALAGESGRGVSILTDALRSGENTPKVRQNLAYAYALDGRWTEARLMAAQDVPAGELDARLSKWAANARPEDSHARVAALLSVPVRADSGQPAQLALNASPAVEQMASEAAASELVPVQAAPAPAPAMAAIDPSWPAAPAPVAAPMAEPQFVSDPVVQPARVASASPAKVAAPARAARAPVRAVPRRADGAPVEARAVAAGGSHLVQLGSFSSEQGARRAWGIFAAKNPELKNFRMTITPATVRGRAFWRVAAAGLDAGGASGLCSSVRTRGGACFAYAASNPPRTDHPGRGQAGPQRARRR